MKKEEIIDSLLVHMTIKESVFISMGEVKTLDTKVAQDKLVRIFGGGGENNPIIQGLKLLKGHEMTWSNSEWIDRLGL